MAESNRVVTSGVKVLRGVINDTILRVKGAKTCSIVVMNVVSGGKPDT